MEAVRLDSLFAVPAVSYEELETDLATLEKERDECERFYRDNIAAYNGAITHVKLQMSRAVQKAAAEEEKRKADEAVAAVQAAANGETPPTTPETPVPDPTVAPPETVPAMVPRRSQQRAEREGAAGAVPPVQEG